MILAIFLRFSRYKEEIVEMEGFGQKSYDNLIDSLEAGEGYHASKSDLQSGNRQYWPC